MIRLASELCCENCFNDEYLKNFIRENGAPGECSFCEKENGFCVEPSELRDIFRPVVGMYEVVDNFMPMGILKEFEGEMIWEKLQYNFDIFSSDDFGIQESIMHSIFGSDYDDNDSPQFLHSFVEHDWWGDGEEAKDQLIEQWQNFCSEIKNENRFFPRKAISEETLIDLLKIFKTKLTIKDFLFRARIAKNGDKIYPSKMGKPPVELATDGRANPKGISYLYLSNDSDTAISEVRPFIGDIVAVGRFRLKKDLYLVDLSNPQIKSPFEFGENLEFVVTYLGFLRMLGKELSKPVNRHDEILGYLPLQYLCEFIKHLGYDGVIYRSALGDGKNMALFEEDGIVCRSVKAHSITKVTYSHTVK